MKMCSDTGHKEPLDGFCELMKQRLENHRLPVDDLCWEELEFRMKPRRREWLWWMGSSVAAAVVALLLLCIPFRTDDMPDRQTELPIALSGSDKESASEPENTPEEASSTVSQPASTKTLIAVVMPNNPLPGAAAAEEEEEEEEEETPKPEAVKEAAEEKTVPDSITQTNHQTTHTAKQSDKDLFASLGKSRKHTGKWSVNAGFGTGGNASFGLKEPGLNGPDYLFSGDPGTLVSISTPPLFEDSPVLSPEEYTHVETRMPLSFGLTVRRDFNRAVGLETGLVYSYLFSNMTKSDDFLSVSRLELHYIGIPVNLIVSLWQNPRWNVYLSGGFMLEKGIRAKQTEERFGYMEKISSVDRRKINGVQWSLNASAGVSYRFYKEWNLYFEPRMSHYFDTNQPVSIRTENAVIVGLGAGVRFDF